MLLFAGSVVSAETLKIMQVSDVHYSLDDNNSGSRALSESRENLKRVITKINARKDVDCVVFTGDNINVSKPEVLKEFGAQVQELNKPYYIVLGNHDVGKAGGIKKEDYMEYIKKINPNQKTASPNYVFYPSKHTKKIVGVVLDGTVPVVQSKHGFFNDKTIDWLDKTLAKNKNHIVIIFQHFPLVPPYDNYEHSVLEPEAYLNLLKKYDNILFIASGHYHAAAVNQDESGIYHISTPSLVSNPKAIRLIELNYNKRKLHKPSDVELKTELIEIRSSYE